MSTIPGHRAATTANRRNQSIRNFDKYKPHKFSDHARTVTIGMLKDERLDIKNMRRAEHGLPPKATYAAI